MMKLLYQEMQERLEYLESQEPNDENKWRIRELTLAIVRVQQLILANTSDKIHDAPEKIWVNIYNPIKTNGWDVHATEKSAVSNSIGAKTHCYIHESLFNTFKMNK